MSLFNAIVQHLQALPIQNNRFIKVHTPLGNDVFVAERVQVFERISPQPFGHAKEPATAGFRIEVVALSGDAHHALKDLIGQSVCVELLTGKAPNDYRPWHGHIVLAEQSGSDGGLARYRLVIEPWLSFLHHRVDSFVFQGQSVREIIDSVFSRYQGQGKLMPQWRWDFANEAVYAKRSLCIQYQETDLNFVQRLMREEGLFYWFEHEADLSDQSTLGAHTLVVADHNNAFQENNQATVRFTQSGASLKEDSLTQWRASASLQTASLSIASADYRTMSLRPAQQLGASVPGGFEYLGIADVPGAYAYADAAQGERLSLRQIQALDAARVQCTASGGWRSAEVGTTFMLADHPSHKGFDKTNDKFVVLSARHEAINNIRADHKAQVDQLLGATQAVALAGDDRVLHNCTITAQPLGLPVRMASAISDHAMLDVRMRNRPNITGVQTAIVVGLSEPVHSDRDQRIKVQFHWQRGEGSSHRLTHTSGIDNAPASDASGTWVRVLQSIAGQNWGSVFTPRLGQEVLISFVNGDIDRPLVIGSVFNGQGQDNAQGNQAGSGAAKTTGNAVAWFPGTKDQTPLQSHQHAAVMSGIKTQELSSSQSGTGGYNQLVFDDSAQANRIELSTTQANTRLQLGSLIQQTDNQRLELRGHGLDLKTDAHGAVRAGQGLLISADAAPGSASAGQQMESRAPLGQIEAGQDLIHMLADTAQKHNAKTTVEPLVAGATKTDLAKQLNAEQGLWALRESLTAKQGGDSNEGTQDTGGNGSHTAWSRPDLMVSAPGGVLQHTPANAIYSAGNTTSLIAGQDSNQLAQGYSAVQAAKGIVMFTYGESKAKRQGGDSIEQKGIQLHAASGNVNWQAQSDALHATADKAVQVSSVTSMVRITAPKHILLTAGGAAIRIEGGNITLMGPGKVEYKAGMKELAGAGTASASLTLAKSTLKGCAKRMQDAAATGAAV
jgi:type VI secretion system secreted protein VgrG